MSPADRETRAAKPGRTMRQVVKMPQAGAPLRSRNNASEAAVVVLGGAEENAKAPYSCASGA